jgi:hypothetical protein
MDPRPPTSPKPDPGTPPVETQPKPYTLNPKPATSRPWAEEHSMFTASKSIAAHLEPLRARVHSLQELRT